MDENRKIYVIGHKNPDTDSICSAIAYADFKRKTAPGNFIAKRAGQINEETQYVLNRFQVSAPGYLSSVYTQVRDVEIRKTQGVEESISLKKAWGLMKESGIVTLPVTSKTNQLEGLITIGDIATSYMEVYDSRILSTARTQYKNILETLDGTMVEGNPHAYFIKGKVVIAATSPDLMEDYVEDDDLVILGNRYESQLCAIEMNAACLIVCEGAKVSQTIRKLARERSCQVISTPHDTYTVARLINQSMPIKHFMTRENLITFTTDDLIDDIKDTMARKRHREFPVVDKRGVYIGMISRRNLLNMNRKQLILVDHNEKSQAVDGIESSEILEIIDHHRLGTIETITPVFFRNQPLGCTATIISQMYRERNIEIPVRIAGLLCAAIISDTLMFRSPTCTAEDRAAAEYLAGIAGIEDLPTFAHEMFRAGSNLNSKSPEEIFYQDFKKFNVSDVSFGVGQINSMEQSELEEIKGKLIPYMEKAFQEHDVTMMFFMLTNIIDERTELICYGGSSKELAAEAFGLAGDTDSMMLEGVVSRKKQLIPAFVTVLQQ
ncbi:putative manganese-dependent inorganic diphosphatase [Diplocloster agilis]|uniref:inorganic diphosphatase n=1 Tax=Diplocloster agilis TaxID=2850323 RepID=A0A949K6N1_9FIRM|nr:MULTISPECIES: putative manganese-dependent inorganic diphosphatase [Lachnospiraceae]MBU9736132.1 putative manganese-dependent inorganic diphosphatase [Diplocloster agilis]MBU9744960.1 putative manganese-dependent inorganic diphosphatase [Diplocloster agilis]MCU6732147.1 putative manganese-dependent inorganic diphosphatase [Suonthocola fibrivorans]SCI35158.1 Manganese-dependent inorganic pyrophosphatase [uncultured Clostridium sp.]